MGDIEVRADIQRHEKVRWSVGESLPKCKIVLGRLELLAPIDRTGIAERNTAGRGYAGQGLTTLDVVRLLRLRLISL